MVVGLVEYHHETNHMKTLLIVLIFITHHCSYLHVENVSIILLPLVYTLYLPYYYKKKEF